MRVLGTGMGAVSPSVMAVGGLQAKGPSVDSGRLPGMVPIKPGLDPASEYPPPKWAPTPLASLQPMLTC